MGMALLSIQMALHTQETGQMETTMAKEYTHGQMVSSTEETINKIRNMDEVL